MRLEEQDALDIIEKKILQVRIERNRLNWKNDWRAPLIKLESVRRYLLSHERNLVCR